MMSTESGQNSLSPRARWVKRAAGSGVVGVSTGLIAHVAMGGQVPGVLGILPALVASVLLGLVFLVRKTLLGTLITTTGSQYLFHQWASLGSVTPQAGHHHGEAPVLALAPEWASGMTFGHAIAAAVTALFVLGHHRAVTVFRKVGELLGQWVIARVPATPRLVVSPGIRIRSFVPPLIRQQWRSSGVGLRAPPAFA